MTINLTHLLIEALSDNEKAKLKAQRIITQGFLHGLHGIEKNLDKFVTVAKKGWPFASKIYARALTEGEFGFEKDRVKLSLLALNGNEEAKSRLINEIQYREFKLNVLPCDFYVQAQMGDEYAQSIFVLCYSKGLGGVSISPGKIYELAMSGYKEAQKLVVEGFRYCNDLFDCNPKSLIECAKKGWGKAKEYLVEWYEIFPAMFEENFEDVEYIASLGSPKAQTNVVNYYKNNLEKLKYYSELGWPTASFYKKINEEEKTEKACKKSLLNICDELNKEFDTNGIKVNKDLKAHTIDSLKLVNEQKFIEIRSLFDDACFENDDYAWEKIYQYFFHYEPDSTTYSLRTIDKEIYNYYRSLLFIHACKGYDNAQGLISEGYAKGIYGFEKDREFLKKLSEYNWYLADFFLKDL